MGRWKWAVRRASWVVGRVSWVMGTRPLPKWWHSAWERPALPQPPPTHLHPPNRWPRHRWPNQHLPRAKQPTQQQFWAISNECPLACVQSMGLEGGPMRVQAPFLPVTPLADPVRRPRGRTVSCMRALGCLALGHGGFVRRGTGGGGTPATTSTSSIRQLLGDADTQTAHPATFSTAPTHQILGSANAETTPAGAPAAAADRKQRPDATCEGKNG